MTDDSMLFITTTEQQDIDFVATDICKMLWLMLDDVFSGVSSSEAAHIAALAERAYRYTRIAHLKSEGDGLDRLSAAIAYLSEEEE